MNIVKNIDAGVLRVAYVEEDGPRETPVVLLHGFPYDVHAYDEVLPFLTAAGCRVLVPYLRGFGYSRFQSEHTMRSGQQGALAHDLLAFLDALGIKRAVLAGYDWGGRAACAAAALWPERVAGLVSCGGYNIQDIAAAVDPGRPENEYRHWYQYYFHGERGRAGLMQNRFELCRLLWSLWSPEWKFDDAVFNRTAESYKNPDFVDVVIHSYRHRYGLVEGDPAYDDTEKRLAERPTISVPTISIDGGNDGVMPLPGSENHDRMFSKAYDRRVLAGVGHNVPQEAPQEFAASVIALIP